MNRTTTVVLATVILGLLFFTYTCTSWLQSGEEAPVESPTQAASVQAAPQPVPPAPAPSPESPSDLVDSRTPSADDAGEDPAADSPVAARAVPSPPSLPVEPAPPIPLLAAVDNTRTANPRTDLNRLVDLRGRYRIALPESLTMATRIRGFPGSTINTPTGFGPGWGQFYGGVSFQERIRYADARDGVMTFGFGLGNPYRTVGVDVAVNVLDTYSEFARDRSLSLRLHRRLPARTSVAVGWENIWHTDGTDGGSSRYAVVSKALGLRDNLESPLGSVVFSLGVGDDRFLSEEKFARGEWGVNPFGAVAVRVLPQASAIANWTGQDLSLGVSIAPIRRWPLVITPAVMDVTGNAGDGARFSISAGLGYNFRY